LHIGFRVDVQRLRGIGLGHPSLDHSIKDIKLGKRLLRLFRHNDRYGQNKRNGGLGDGSAKPIISILGLSAEQQLSF
jgi:hypothetical protein